jgi:hypothetical protein
MPLEARARDYFEAMQSGLINNRIEDGMRPEGV